MTRFSMNATATTKRGGPGAGPEPGEITVVPVPLSPDLLRVLRTWISSRPEPRPALPEVIRFALREWLMARELRRHLGPAADEGPATEGPDHRDASRDLFGPPDA